MKSQVNIGMNGSMLDEHPTGVGIYSLNVINHLSSIYQKEHNRKITVFTPTKTLLNKDVHTVLLPGLLKSSRYGKIAAFSRFAWNTFYYPIQARKFDVLVSTTTHGSFLLKKQIITIHDLLSLRFNNISPHQRFYFRYLLPYLAAKAKLIIAVSETTKQDIMHFLNCPEEKIKVIYNGYDEVMYNNTASLQAHSILDKYKVGNYFLAIGPTYPHKNFEWLIKVYSSLDAGTKARHPLVIAGGMKKYLATLKKLVAETGQDQYIHFIGYVPIELMPSLYKEAFALVFPSLYEGFGFPLLEAMASGCPVLTSNVSSMPEVCEDAALYFDPCDEQSLKLQLERLINDPQLYRSMKESGVLQARKFSWSKTVHQLQKVIEENIN